MKAVGGALIFAMTSLAGTSAAFTVEDTNPLAKTIELLESLAAKIKAEGEAEAKAFKEYMDWCDDVCNNGRHRLNGLIEKRAKNTACVEKSGTCITTGGTNIEALIAQIATAEGELKDATLIREKEHADFSAAEKELMDAIDALERAIAIISREMAKNPALLQTVDTSTTQRLSQTLTTVIEAAGFAVPDQKKLLELVQARANSKQEDEAEAEADEAELGAPSAAGYKTHSTSIVEVLEDMLEKAEAELKALRKAEGNLQHNYMLLKQSLMIQIAEYKKAIEDSKGEINTCTDDKAYCTGLVTELDKEIPVAEDELKTAQATCMQVAADHEISLASRAEELKALAQAQKILKSSTPGAEAATYSFVQVASQSQLKTRVDLANAEVVSLLKHLAQQQHSLALSQLASKVSAMMRYGAATGEDPFAKVKALITDLIDRLMKEAAAEATEKAYCDSEMAKTEAKKSDLEDDVAKLTAKIDKSTAASVELKSDVKELQAELAALAGEQAEMDKIRKEQSEEYKTAKADLEMGLEGVKKALEVLRDFYGGAFLQDGSVSGDFMQQPPIPTTHKKADGAGGSIINVLGVVESDMAGELTKRTMEETDAQSAYDKMTQENKVKKTLMDQDVKYKTESFKHHDKAVAELSSDLATENAELSAVMDYYGKLKDRCIAQPETYEERKRRRDAEISGLKQALTILESETTLVQKGSRVLRR